MLLRDTIGATLSAAKLGYTLASLTVHHSLVTIRWVVDVARAGGLRLLCTDVMLAAQLVPSLVAVAKSAETRSLAQHALHLLELTVDVARSNESRELFAQLTRVATLAVDGGLFNDLHDILSDTVDLLQNEEMMRVGRQAQELLDVILHQMQMQMQMQLHMQGGGGAEGQNDAASEEFVRHAMACARFASRQFGVDKSGRSDECGEVSVERGEALVERSDDDRMDDEDGEGAMVPVVRSERRMAWERAEGERSSPARAPRVQHEHSRVSQQQQQIEQQQEHNGSRATGLSASSTATRTNRDRTSVARLSTAPSALVRSSQALVPAPHSPLRVAARRGGRRSTSSSESSVTGHDEGQTSSPRPARPARTSTSLSAREAQPVQRVPITIPVHADRRSASSSLSSSSAVVSSMALRDDGVAVAAPLGTPLRALRGTATLLHRLLGTSASMDDNSTALTATALFEWPDELGESPHQRVARASHRKG